MYVARSQHVPNFVVCLASSVSRYPFFTISSMCFDQTRAALELYYLKLERFDEVS
jgi:hypothetical protein